MTVSTSDFWWRLIGESYQSRMPIQASLNDICLSFYGDETALDINDVEMSFECYFEQSFAGRMTAEVELTSTRFIAVKRTPKGIKIFRDKLDIPLQSDFREFMSMIAQRVAHEKGLKGCESPANRIARLRTILSNALSKKPFPFRKFGTFTHPGLMTASPLGVSVSQERDSLLNLLSSNENRVDMLAQGWKDGVEIAAPDLLLGEDKNHPLMGMLVSPSLAGNAPSWYLPQQEAKPIMDIFEARAERLCLLLDIKP